MLNKTPLFWVLLIAFFIGGAIALLVGAIVNIVVGAIVLIIAMAGIAFWLTTLIGRPLDQLSEAAKAIETSMHQNTELPDVRQISAGVGSEVAGLVSNIQDVMVTFQTRLTELDSIHAISQTITSAALDYEKTVKSVLAAVQKVVDYDAAEVAVLHGTQLTVEAWWGKDGFKDTTGRKYRIGKGPTGTIAQTKAPLFLATVQATEDLQRTIGYASVETEFIAKTTKLVINSFLGIPLLIGDRLIGTLTLVHHEAGFFTEDDKRQLNKLADHASIAIDNALQVRKREAELQDQIRELRIEIDQAKLTKQVEEVTDTEYFRRLQANASKMRERHNRSEADEDVSESENS